MPTSFFFCQFTIGMTAVMPYLFFLALSVFLSWVGRLCMAVVMHEATSVELSMRCANAHLLRPRGKKKVIDRQLYLALLYY
ncbi:hypothetical protein B0J13DRAFT_554184 [Dactylonectria estremocensis]|uniref:Uncharacterized protein n=1 Tax=Dactylonectria estremocensis TaxID=1079267 RepID=A0A9P9J759_9HYPO|nr:hypothetical protein B0J13DRAFT_554184 [Dactylonectria estremocensis]